MMRAWLARNFGFFGWQEWAIAVAYAVFCGVVAAVVQ